jgi:hypothetical protein
VSEVSRHPIAGFVTSVLVVIGVGVGVQAATGHGRLVEEPTINALIQAVNGQGGDWHVTLAPPGTQVRVSESQANASSAAQWGRSPWVQAVLVRWRDEYPRHSPFVWAVFTGPERSNEGPTCALSLHGRPICARYDYNYYVTFIDGETGASLASEAGRAAHLQH